MFDYTDVQVFPATTNEKLRAVHQAVSNTSAASQSTHKKNQLSCDQQIYVGAPVCSNRNAEALNSKQPSGKPSSNNKPKTVKQYVPKTQQQFRTATLDLSASANTNHLQHSYKHVMSHQYARQQQSASKRGGHNQTSSIASNQSLQPNALGYSVNYYQQANLSLVGGPSLNQTQNSSVLAMISSQQRCGGKESVVSSTNEGSDCLRGDAATTVVSVKDIDRRLLNLMKSMGN